MVKFSIGGVEYKWSEGHSLDWFSSIEKHVEPNSVRCLHGKLFYAKNVMVNTIRSKWIEWAPVEKDFVLKLNADPHWGDSYTIYFDIRNQWFNMNILKVKNDQT